MLKDFEQWRKETRWKTAEVAAAAVSSSNRAAGADIEGRREEKERKLGSQQILCL